MAKLVDEQDALGSYDEMLDEPGPVTVAGQDFDPSRILREVDPIAYRVGFSDYLDAQGWTLEEAEADDETECDDSDAHAVCVSLNVHGAVVDEDGYCRLCGDH